MIKTYERTYKLYLNGHYYDCCVHSLLEDESKMNLEEEVHTITWENIEENYKYVRTPVYASYLRPRKKGLELMIDRGGWSEIYIKQWKEPLDIVVKVKTEECEPRSLEWIMKYSDSDMAIQYLKDRGLSVCPYNTK